MTFEMRLNDERKDERNLISRLLKKLLDEGKTDEIKAIANDYRRIDELLKQYDITETPIK